MNKPKESIIKRLQNATTYSNHLVMPKSWLKALDIEEEVRLELYEDRIEIKKEEKSEKK